MTQTSQTENQPPSSVPEAVSRAFHTGMKLHLNSEDIAFIAGIQTYVEIEHSFSLEFSDLEKIFYIVNEIAKSSQDNLSQRTHNAVERLLKNQMIIRVDGGGISHRPVYDVTQLGKAIVAYMTSKTKLTRQNLTIITSRIISFLADIRRALTTSGSQSFWEEKVLMPLGIVVSELLEAIEKRQKGLDIEQQEVRSQISELLEKQWMDALEACETLLSTTSGTLQELYRTLLSENSTIKLGLNDIYEQAERHGQPKVLEIVENIYNRLDQLEQWGKERVASWSQYYRRVNDFLQSIVRFDPNREVSYKLKEQIRSYPQDPWFMQMIEPTTYRTIREINLAPKKESVTRDKQAVEEDDTQIDDDGNRLLDMMIEDVKSLIKKNEPLDLANILEPYFEEYSIDLIYPHIGTLMDLILKEVNQLPEGSLDWIVPVPELEMQNLLLSKPRQKAEGRRQKAEVKRS